jgi:hypothetical protein
MKKYVLTFLCMALLAGGAMAQKAPKLPKSVKEAKKALNASKYSEALKLINTALEDPTAEGMAEAWAVKGEVYGGMVATDDAAIIKTSVTGGTPTVNQQGF